MKMKKNLIRGIALALVLILALGIIPLAAMAVTVDVWNNYMDTNNVPTLKDAPIADEYVDSKTGTSSVTIKTSDYNKYLLFNGEVYDRAGLLDWEAYFELYSGSTYPDPDTLLPLTSSLTFKDGLGLNRANLIYTAHSHKLSRWYSDGTTHWRECLVCKQLNPSHEIFFIYQNWCQDGDEDQVCNVCGGHVPYHDITVIDSEGGKITVNRDNASHRMKITADVETNDGYQFVKLHFTKVRPDGSKQEVVRYGQGKSFWTNMPTYPMEVTAEFIKK